jgi:aryl-alcohol dehydrogenase-like predicted oxidoreductase
MYGNGANEEQVGRAIRGRREEAVQATKFGFVKFDAEKRSTVRGDAEYVRQACDASLLRLQVDHIDLYYQHRVDNFQRHLDFVKRLREIAEKPRLAPIPIS